MKSHSEQNIPFIYGLSKGKERVRGEAVCDVVLFVIVHAPPYPTIHATSDALFTTSIG